MLPESQHDSSGLSEMAPTMSVPGRRSRTYPRSSAQWPSGALEMVPSASKADAQAATSRDEEIACRAVLYWFRSLGGALRVRMAMWPNRSRARVALFAVASIGLGPSREVSNRLRL
jgi:hypothetical protein